jgi:hypothetical protein
MIPHDLESSERPSEDVSSLTAHSSHRSGFPHPSLVFRHPETMAFSLFFSEQWIPTPPSSLSDFQPKTVKKTKRKKTNNQPTPQHSWNVNETAMNIGVDASPQLRYNLIKKQKMVPNK